MRIQLPRGLEFDLDTIPDNFEAQILQAFHDFTEDTNKDYTYQDKLLFIDRVVNHLHGRLDDGALVDEWIDEYAKHERNENGYFVSENDVYSWDSMVEMVELGRKQQSLYSEYVEKGSREDEKIMKLLLRAIKIVINYEEAIS